MKHETEQFRGLALKLGIRFSMALYGCRYPVLSASVVAQPDPMQPTGICRRLIDFIMNTLFARSFFPQSPLKNPRPYGKEEAAIRGKRSKNGCRKRSKKPLMSPDHGIRSEASSTHLKPEQDEARPKLPVHFKPRFLDVESNINDKTGEFIRSRKAAMRQTDTM